MEAEEFDMALRLSAFSFLDHLRALGGETVRFDDVARFHFDGTRVPLMDPRRGIRKPRQLDAALSFRTVHSPRPDRRPYNDEPGPDGYLRYMWQGEDSLHAENVALRRALQRRLPLVWFHGIDTGVYLPVYPVELVAEEPELRRFVVALDPDQSLGWFETEGLDLSTRRRYAERTVLERLHQPMFRARVLRAYERSCAICHLRHDELLDAAHILSDSEGGEPIVPNGIALCKIHHAAFDFSLIGVRPDYRIEVREDVRAESDGPTLRHSLQEVHGTMLELPRQRAARPDHDLLEIRYARFREAS
jgi:putative restriction endonuclease